MFSITIKDRHTQHNDTQYNDIQYCHADCLYWVSQISHYAACHYAECRYAEYRYAECYNEAQYAEWTFDECRYVERRYAECLGTQQNTKNIFSFLQLFRLFYIFYGYNLTQVSVTCTLVSYFWAL
jgi:hypothetical protein